MDIPMTNLPEERAAFPRQPAKWHGIVEDLAEEFSCPISVVEQMLSTAAHQLEQGAQINVFVPLLALKQVKDLLRPYRQTPPRHELRDLTPSPVEPSAVKSVRSDFHLRGASASPASIFRTHTPPCVDSGSPALCFLSITETEGVRAGTALSVTEN